MTVHLEHESELGVPEGNVALARSERRDHVAERAEGPVDVLSLPASRAEGRRISVRLSRWAVDRFVSKIAVLVDKWKLTPID